MTLALIGLTPEDAQHLLARQGVTDVRICYCLPPEDKRLPDGEMRVLRANIVNETAFLTVSAFKTAVSPGKET